MKWFEKKADFSFKLKWDELSEELREQKVDEVLEYDLAEGNIEQERVDEDEEGVRKDIEKGIAAHFPVYF